MTDLVEVPVESVFIVDNSGDERQHQAPAAPHFSLACPVVHVLPQHPSIFFMQAHGLGNLHHLP